MYAEYLLQFIAYIIKLILHLWLESLLTMLVRTLSHDKPPTQFMTFGYNAFSYI